MADSDSQRVARWWDRVIAFLWVANLGWVTWQLGGFVPGPMMVGLPVAFVISSMVILRWWVIVPQGAPKGWWYPLPFLGWVSVHMLGLAELPSRAWLHGWHLWSGLAAYWVGLHLMRRPSVWRPALAGVGCVALGVVTAGIYQRIGDPTWLPLDREQVGQYLRRSAGTFGNPNNAAAWLAMVLPVALAFGWRDTSGSPRSRLLARIVAVVCLTGIFLSFSRGVGLALTLGFSVWVLSQSAWTWAKRLLLVAVLAVAGTGAVWLGYQSSGEVRQRVDSLVEHRGERTRPLLWGIALDLWSERPVVGYGGQSFEMLMEKHRPEGLWESARYAHNEYLNFLSDYGIAGAALLSFGLGMALKRRLTRRQTPIPGAGWALLILAAACSLDFHLQSPSVLWLAAWEAAAWLGERGARDFTTRKQPFLQIAAVGTAAAFMLLPLIWTVPSLRAEELRWRAREQLDKLEGVKQPAQISRVADEAAADLNRAVAIDPHNERAWMDYSYALSLQEFGNVEVEAQQGKLAEAAARRALEASDLVAEHWLRLGMALQLQGEWADAGPAFGRAVKLAPRQPVMWHYQGHHFSLRPPTHALARAALATCLRLDPGYDAAKLLKAELERSP